MKKKITQVKNWINQTFDYLSQSKHRQAEPNTFFVLSCSLDTICASMPKIYRMFSKAS